MAEQKSESMGTTDPWARLERLLSILAQEISSVRERQIAIANRISEKIAEAGSPLLGDAGFMGALQDFDLMSQELEHTASLLAAVSESLSDQETVEVAINQGIEAVKLSSMRSRLRAVVDGTPMHDSSASGESEIW